MRRRLIHALAFSTAGLMAGAAIAQPPAGAAPLQPIAGTRLDVQATGEVTRAPDLATISAGVVTQGATAAAAMAENAQKMAQATAALRKAGLADRDIATQSINLQPQYRYGETRPPVLTGYQATNQLSVRFRDLKKAGPILDALVAQGINQISGPNLSIDKPETALDEARTKAVQAARARADIYARAAGLTVKRILSISEGGPEPIARPVMMRSMAMKVGEAADTQIEAGEQSLSVTLSVSFELG